MPANDKLAYLARRLRDRALRGEPFGDDFDADLAELSPEEWRALLPLQEARVAHGEEQAELAEHQLAEARGLKEIADAVREDRIDEFYREQYGEEN